MGERVKRMGQQVLERGADGIASGVIERDHGAMAPEDGRAVSGRRKVLSERKQNAESVKLAGIFGQMARGEHTALAGCYDLMGPVVFSLAVRMLRDRHAAEDVVQDIFVQIWRQAGNYDTARGTPEAWMMMIARGRGFSTASGAGGRA